MLSRRNESDLVWRFGNGADVILRMASSIPESGIRGQGNSGTKGCFVGAGPDPTTLARFGRIERSLRRLDPVQRDALALAYGDAGAIATTAGLYASRRWRAVAPMTATARERGLPWAEAHPSRNWKPVPPKPPKKIRESEAQALQRLEDEERHRDPTLGDAPARFVHHLLSGAEDKENALGKIETEARQMLTAASDAYERAAIAVEHGEAATMVTNIRAAQAAGVTASQRRERGEIE